MNTTASGSTATTAELLEFMKLQRYAVVATTTGDGAPEAALIGFVVNDRLELLFDSFDSTRKVANLRRDPRIALVIGGHTLGDERTVQYEGTVDVPEGVELEALRNALFMTHPDGVRRSKLKGIGYYRVRPLWIRYTDLNSMPARIVVFDRDAVRSEAPAEGRPAVSPYTQLQEPWRPAIESGPLFNAFADTTHQVKSEK